MKSFIIGTILFILSGLLIGCKTTGYTVRIKTDALEYNEIPKIEAMLTNKDYNIEWREKIRHQGADPSDVSTSFEKKFSREKVIQKADPNNIETYFKKIYNEERYWWVGINLLYVKDISNNVVRHIEVDVYNQFIGAISPEIKGEIDSIGDLLYQKLVDKVGKENVTIERREWGPPRCFLVL